MIIPPLEEETQLPTTREASDAAFYAASTATDDPIAAFHNAKMDLISTGQSDVVDKAQKEWDEEQKASLINSVGDVINDPTLDRQTKLNVIDKYRLGDYLPKTLKDRYIEKTASNNELEDTELQRQQQEWVVANMQRRRDQMAMTKRDYDLVNNTTKLQSFLGGFSHLYQGVENTLGLISDKEYKEGNEKFKRLQEANPISAGAGNVAGLLSGAIAVGAGTAVTGAGALAVTAASALTGGALAGGSRFAELGQTQADLDARIKASLTDAGFTAADFALPIFKAAGLLKTMVMNGAGAVVLGEMSTAAQNTILEAYPELKQAQFDPTNMSVNAILGSLIGAVFGRRARAPIPTEEPTTQGQARRPAGKPMPSGSSGGRTFEGESVRVPEDIPLLSAPETPQPVILQLGNKAIPPDTPADVTAMANPKVATDLGMSALEEPSGAMADALGTTKAAIVHDWVLPKMDESEFSVDLSRKLKAREELMKELFVDMRHNPSVVSATQREADHSKIYEVVRESRDSVYQPANSLYNFADNVVEGKMVFGPNEEGLFKDLSSALRAKESLDEVIASLPEEMRGVTDIINRGPNNFSLEWRFRKEYDDNMILTFGPDSIKATFAGGLIDASGLARSGLSRWMTHTKFQGKVEQGALRAPEREARLFRGFTQGYSEAISQTRHKAKLAELIEDAEALGKEFFTKSEISARFPELSQSAIDGLFDAHTYWRRMNHFIFNFFNREIKNDLIKDDMVGLYGEDGTYIGPVSHKIKDDVNTIREVWDFEKNAATAYNANNHPQDKTLVRLGNKIDEKTDIYTYGLVGPNQKIDLLPNEVLPRIPGYSPRKVEARWFVDAVPTRIRINGMTSTDERVLRGHTKTIAASRTEEEGNAIIQNMASDYEGYTLQVRPERQDSFGDTIVAMELHGAMLNQSMRRGERLPSLHGPAPLEDRLVTGLRVSKSLSRMGAFREWDNAFKESYVRGFSRFLSNGEFPRSKLDIKPLPNMTREEDKLFKTALRAFEFHYNQHNFDTFGDVLWKEVFHNVGDVFEKWKIPSEWIRKIGDTQNQFERLPKQLATFAYIHSNPLRQWLIQPAQLWEMAMVDANKFPEAAHDLAVVRMHIFSDIFPEFVSNHFKKQVLDTVDRTGGDADDLQRTITAIRKSGMMEGIDMNVLVHGIFKDVDRALTDSAPVRVMKDAESLIKAAPRASRAVGFDPAELTNRIGLFLQVKNHWISQNPGKKWDTKENIENIASEALRRSGSMNRAGNLRYQEGFISSLMQFAAITHKLTLNLLQDQATTLTGSQRARLAAARLALYGLEGGLIGLGPLLYYYIDQSEDPVMVEAANDVREGLVDYVANNLVAAIIDPDTPSDLAVSQGMSPYSEKFLPYFDLIAEMVKLFDQSPATNPRFAGVSVMGSLMTAINEMRGWFVGRELTTENVKQAMLEAAEISSGWSNYSKGVLMLGMGEKVSSMGNPLGIQYSKAEAIGKMFFGVNSRKEQLEYEALAQFGDHKQGMKQIAKDIHKSMMNVRNKIGEQDWEQKGKQINAYMSLLPESQFTEQHKIMIIDELIKLDRRAYTSIRQSLIADILKYHRDGKGETATRGMNTLSRSVDPKTQELVKMWREGKL